MNCRTFVERMDQYLNGTLDRAAHDAAGAHLRECADCQRSVAMLEALRAVLRDAPMPAPRPGFFDQALARAQAAQPRRRRYWPYVTGAAIAASLSLWVVLGDRPNLSPASTPASVTITLNQARTVQLAFNAEHELEEATLSIELPDGVDLEGFPGQREVRWRTNLARGANLLSLPLIARSPAGGTLLARVEYGNRRTQLVIPLHVSDHPHTGAHQGACAPTNTCDSLSREKPYAPA